MTADDLRLLGLSTGASQKDIKQAFRKLAREMHPDISPHKSDHELFKRVLLAYEALTVGIQNGPHKPDTSETTYHPPVDWRALRTLCVDAVQRLRQRAAEAVASSEETIATACTVAAKMLEEAIERLDYSLRHYRPRDDGPVRPPLLNMADKFVDATQRLWIDHEDTIAAHLIRGHLGAVGLARSVEVAGRHATPAQKELAARAILAELTKSLLAVGALTPRPALKGSQRVPIAALLEAATIAVTEQLDNQ